jgi:hypothetical protein
LVLRHLEVGASPGAHAGEHQVGVGVFVIGDHQEAVVGAAAHGQRVEAEIVVVIAELLFLGGGRQVGGIEGRRAGDHGIAPADDHLHVVALGHMLLVVERVRELLERERRGSGVLRDRRQWPLAERRDRARAQQAAHRVASIEALVDQFADRRHVVVFAHAEVSCRPR